jgi:hypothetical protein
MSLESWKAVFEIGGVALIAITFIFGAGALIVNNRINAIQAKELKDFKIRFEEEQQKTALAQREAAEAKQLAGGFEKDISTANQRAAEANERAASLEVTALGLRKQLMLQGARENLITGENRRKLVDALKPFSGQHVDVRRSAFPMMVNGKIVSVTPIGDDTLGLAQALLGVVKDAGWLSPPSVLPWGIQETGISVEITDGASASTRSAAEALVMALRSISLSVNGPMVLPFGSNRFARVGTVEQATPPLLGKDTILLGILTHPK